MAGQGFASPRKRALDPPPGAADSPKRPRRSKLPARAQRPPEPKTSQEEPDTSRVLKPDSSNCLQHVQFKRPSRRGNRAGAPAQFVTDEKGTFRNGLAN